LLGVSAAFVASVQQLPLTFAGAILTAGAGVVVTTVVASLLEWLVHRYIYHRRSLPFLGRIYAIHHQGHHHAIFPTWRYVTNGPPRRHPIQGSDVSYLHPPGWRNTWVKLCHFAFYMTIAFACIWAPAWLVTQNVALLVSMMVTSAALSDLFVRVHDAIHYPGKHPVLEAQPWFQFLDRHHYIHHVDTEANVNFLLPLTDWCFGTLRRTLTAEELAKHGSWEEAKAHPIGASEPARIVAKPRRAEGCRERVC
jgi:hypothetical protein